MKVIRSNPWGFGIHSPYVYQLVTKVIFGKQSFSPKEKSALRGSGNGVWGKKNQLCRLILDFEPDRIMLAGEGRLADLLGSPLFQQFPYRPIFPEEISLLGNEKEIVIFDDYYGTLFDIPDYQVPAIWVLFNLFDLNSKSLFNKLRNSQHVALTIEVNRMGIAIFNRNFKKQDFKILRWFFF